MPADRIAELEAQNQVLTEFLAQMAQIYDSSEYEIIQLLVNAAEKK